MRHGSSNKKRNYILGFCLVSFVFLTGYAFYKPKLINANKPFIELSGSIGTSIGNAKDAYEYEHPKVEPAKPTPTPVKPTPTPVKPEVRTQADIVVSGESVSLDGRACKNVEDFETMIRGKEYDSLSFVLIDDYAEATTYRAVKRVLEDVGKKYSPQTKE